jgi:putative tryptophan/tyrosine transport system substrate-binding protein
VKTRWQLLAVFAAGLFAVPLGSFAQQPEKVWRIGILAPARRPEQFEGLAQGLRELGYIEGKNLVTELRVAEGNYERLPDLAAELVKLRVDVIVTQANPGTRAALKATTTIPIVFTAGDPVGNGLVKSLAQPGGNATGMSGFAKDLTPKQLEMLASMVPKLRRVAVLLNPANFGHLRNFKGIQAAANAARLDILSVPAQTEGETQDAISQMAKEGAGAFIWIDDPLFNQQLRQIAELAVKHRLPSIALNPLYADAGGLIGYGSNPADGWRRLAIFVDRIFKGANPGDLPVEQPTKLELVINRKTAKALGLEIPPDLLVLADKVIE